MMNERRRSERDAALTPQAWSRLAALFDEALARTSGERDAFLAAACGEDSSLRSEIDSLLDAHARTDGPLERLVSALGVTFEPAAGWIGRRIGPYTIVREVGRGGMGVVYQARRTDGQYDRDVALKVIGSPLHDVGERERFLLERQILAHLKHAGVAQLFDGGVTEEGLPYFTMELVEGTPIDAHCDEQRLDIASRLELFACVCDAVAAAHRNLVVHRDLKPSNILVTPDGSVKLLDFGIAKALDAQGRADVTAAGHELFTPDYASPEQVRSGPITTAADIYSLGAVLYQLLTGLKPHRFTSNTPAEVERTICERDPVRPSAAVSALLVSPEFTGPNASDVAIRRGTRPDRLARRLEGDLDTIVLKALQKDPARRYASVELLRQDVLNHLYGLPVSAQPDRWTYRTWKLLTRHRAAALAIALIVTSLTVGLVGTVIQARRAEEQRALAAVERDRARAEAERVKRVSSLLVEMFRLADPGQGVGTSITARELLDRGTQRIETELARDPETQAWLFDAVGQVYRNLALYTPGENLLQRAVALRRKIYGEESLLVAESLRNLAGLYLEQSDFKGAEKFFREALALQRRHGAPAPDVAASLHGLGDTLSETGKYDEAIAFLREALALRRLAAPDAPEIVATLDELGLALHRKGDFRGAELLFREAVDHGRRQPFAVTPATVSSTLNLARLVHRFDRDPAGAEPLYREALNLARRLYAGDHPDVADCLSELARGIRDRGDLVQAEAVTREALAMWRRLYGNRHRETMISAQTLAGLLAQNGKPLEAERLFREALATGRSLFGETHMMVLGSKSALAGFLENERRFDEALALRVDELAGAMKRFGEGHAIAARSFAALGRHQSMRGRHADAERHLRRALEIRERVHPAGHWRIAEAKAALGHVLLRARRLDDAEPLLRAGYDGLRASREAPPEGTRAARDDLIALYELRGQPERAARYRRIPE